MRNTGLPGRAGALLLTVALAGCAGNELPVDATPDDILTYAEKKLAEEDYFDAVEVLEFFLREHPGTARTPVAKIRLGDAHFGLKEYVLARGEYEDVVNDFPASPYVEEARFKIARCSYASILPYYLDQSETERAIRLFAEFLRDYPESRFREESGKAVADCQERLARGEYESGKFYQKQKRFRPASIQYKHVIESYPATGWAPKAAVRLAQMYELRERWEEAESWYRRVLRDWPDTEEAAAAGQALALLPGRSDLTRLPATEDGK